MYARKVKRFMVGLLLACLLFSTSAVAAKTKITMWMGSVTEEVKPWLQDFVDQFNTANHDIELELTLHPSVTGMREKVIVSSAGGAGPDIYSEGTNVVSMYVSNGLARPLDGFLAKMPDRGDFIEDLFRDLTFDGNVYAVPYTVRPFADAYNMYLFEAAGAELPRTWDEMITAVRKITRVDSDGAAVINGYAANFTARITNFNDFEMYMLQSGKTTIGPSSDRAEMNNQTGQSVLKYMKDLYQYGMPDKKIKGIDSFMAGKVAVYHSAALGHTSFMSAVPSTGIPEETVFSRFVGPTPQSSSVQYIGSSLLMNTHTNHPEEAWRVIEAMTSAEAIKGYLMAHGLQLAPRKSLFADADLLGRPYVREATMLLAPPLAPFGSRHVLYSDFRASAGDFLTKAITADLAVQTALEEAERIINSIVGGKK